MGGRNSGLTKADASVLREVRRRPLVARSQIVSATGLNPATVWRALKRLGDAGLVYAEEANDHLIQLAPEAATVIGVDLTLERAQVAVADLDLGRRNDPSRAVVDVAISDPEATLDAIASLVTSEAERSDVQPAKVMGVGVGLPGPISRDSGAPDSPHILPGWEGVSVRDGLVRRLEQSFLGRVPAVVTNDASLGALGAYTRGRALHPAGAPDDLLYIRVSFGVGAGLVLKGHLVTGAHGFAGEIGHIRVLADGPLCTRCHQRGCLEQMASRGAVLERIRQRAREDEQPVPSTLEVALEAPDAATLADVKEAGWHLGMVLAGITNLLNPSSVVLGGWLAEQVAFYDSVQATVQRYALAPLTADLDITTWNRMPQQLSAIDGYRPDPGKVYSPELLGALAYVVDELGDRYLLTKQLQTAPA